MELKDKVVVITGGTKGLGKAMAEAFVKEGAKVSICALNKDEIEKVSAELGIFGMMADVRNEEDMQRLFKLTAEKYGHVDIWINNAGKWLIGPVEDVEMQKVKEMFDVNIIGAINGCRVAIREMKKNNSGTIVNIISKVALGVRPELAPYVATKWALNGFTKTLREEINDFNIPIFAIFPGGIKTAMYDEVKPETYPNYAEPEEVANKIINNLKAEKPELDLIILKEGEKILKSNA